MGLGVGEGWLRSLGWGQASLALEPALAAQDLARP